MSKDQPQHVAQVSLKPKLRLVFDTAALLKSMHEVAIMNEAVRMAGESAAAAGAKRVTALKLRVGRLSGAVPEALQFAWDVVRRGTLLEEAVLEIESVPAVCWCAKCQAEFESKEFCSECPRCRELSGELRHGRELEIAAVECE